MKKLFTIVLLFAINLFLYAVSLENSLLDNTVNTSLKDKKSQSCITSSSKLAAISCVQNGSWNNPATWNTNSVPTINDDVTIGMGFTVTLSGAAQVQKITVMGTLKPQSNTTNFSMNTKGILVMGSNALFEIGNSGIPYTGIGTITLTGSTPNENLFAGTSLGTKVIAAMDGGIIRMEGQEKKSWTNLGLDAAVGATQISLKETVGWQVGDEIVIVSSRSDWNEAEKRTITAINNSNKTVSFSPALIYPHVGTSYNYTRSTDGKVWTADIRAEVGLLSHNIKIQGDASSDTNGFGGHIMIDTDGMGYVNNVELYRMGQKAMMGRYPFHWHMLATNGTGQYIKNSSIHQSFNRAVTIHGTHNTTVENNFCYDHIGHGIFFENGSEINNLIKGNVVLLTKRPAVGEQLTLSDNQLNVAQNRTPSSYWITNPNNTFINNVAAGTQGTGFWYALANNFMFESASDPRFTGQTLPYKEVFGGFTGNKAHSCMNGFDIFDRLDANHSIIANDSWDEPNPKFFNNNTWYSNEIGIYSGTGGGRKLSSLLTFSNDIFVENYTNSMLASYVTIDQSLFVANSGHNLRSGTRFLHRIYDGPATIKNTHVVGYNANNANFLDLFGADVRHPNHIFENITFDPQAPIKAISKDFSNTSVTPMFWLTVVKDKTGSLTGINNSSIVINHPMLLVGDEIKSHDWVNYSTSLRSYVNASLYYNASLAPLPFLSLTRSKMGTPTRMFYESYNTLSKHQMMIIANDDFLYTYQFQSLPTNKEITMWVYDANIGDSYVACFKDFGKLGGLSVKVNNISYSIQTSLANLTASATGGFFVQPNGDLYIKTFANTQERSYSIKWTTDFVVPTLDTDGDGYDDAREMATSSGEILVRNPGDATDLSFKFSTTTEGWLAAGTVGTTCVGCNNSWEITSNGTNPQILRNGLNFDANRVSNIFADVKSTITGDYKLYWTTTDEPVFSEDKSMIAPIIANTRSLLNFSLQGHSKWNDKNITQLRLNLVNGSAANSVYSIFADKKTMDTDRDGMSDVEELEQCRNYLDASDFGLNFSSPAETTSDFNTNSISNFKIENGIVSGTSDGGSYFWNKSSKYGFNGSAVTKLKLRIKTNSAAKTRFFWENEDGSFAGSRQLDINHNAPNVWQELVLDLSSNPNWIGKTIKNFRIDPAVGTGVSFEIDRIISFNYTECSTLASKPDYKLLPLLREIKIFPNPVSDTVIIQIAELADTNLNIGLYDALGKLLKSTKITKGHSSTRLDVQDFCNGIYFVKISDGRYSVTKRLIIGK